MDYIIDGKKPLFGELQIYGAKNCALALLGATVLTSEEVTLKNCPQIADVENMLLLLQTLGKKVVRQDEVVSVSGNVSTAVPKEKAKLLRGSGLVLGGLVAAYGQAFLPSIGGCAIGARPIDIHLEGLEAMGVSVEQNQLGTKCFGKPKGCFFRLRFPSVGATENLLCAASLAGGTTLLANCALEPEVVALEQMLVQMGARISGVGTSRMEICGVSKLHGTEFTVIPDRIVACTYLACVASAGGCVSLTNCNPQHFQAFLHRLKKPFEVKTFSDAVTLCANGRPKNYGETTTAPYPKFPTDCQQLLLSLCAQSDGGISYITENLFENRLAHNAEQLNKMGGNVELVGNKAKIVGKNLLGGEVIARDLRGGAGLVVAALGAEGKTVVHEIEHVFRGYRNFAEELRLVGASIVEE